MHRLKSTIQKLRIIKLNLFYYQIHQIVEIQLKK